MKPERWQKLDRLFQSAVERPPSERAAFLDEACAGDESLHKHIEQLLTAHDKAESFIERPAIDVEARALASQGGNGDPQLTAQIFGHYRILEQLGVGGMGEVYLAEDMTLGRKVALKLLPVDFTRNKDRVRRFQQEARAASGLNHPNIITIYEIAHVNDRYLIATEFIDGETLRERIRGSRSQTSEYGSEKAGTALPIREVLNISIQIADALAAAHEAGIVHRDIKPENIMVRRDDYIKVLDFGLAKLSEPPAVTHGYNVDTEAVTRAQVKTSAGLVMGTVTYMSPEQTRGEQVDARTDIWSVGVVIYELIAGCAPFERATPSEVIAAVLDSAPVPLTDYVRAVPSELERIISKALTKEREQRYQTVKDLLIDLKDLRHQLRTTQSSSATPRAGVSAAHTASSAEYVVGEIKRHKLAALLVFAALVLVTAGAVAYYSYYSKRSEVISSVAVLPFANQSGDPNMDYLSDGLSESIINSLSQLSSLKVISRSSAFKYKGKEIDPEQVARDLGVQAIVVGRVIQRGDQLQVSAEMVNVSDKTQMWGEQFNRKATEALAVQMEISQQIAEKLKLHLTNAEQQQLIKDAKVNPQAYELLLKGRFERVKNTLEGNKKAVEYLNQAIAIDEKYAVAYAELAGTYSQMIGNSLLDPKEGTPKAEAAAKKALELDQGLAEAHLALGRIKQDAWDWVGEEQEFRRALELNPNLAGAHHLYSQLLARLGRHEQAIAEARRAKELDPLSINRTVNVGYVLYCARQYDQAIEQLKKTLEVDKNYAYSHQILAYTYAALGRYNEAIAEYEVRIRLARDNTSDQCYLGYALARAGRRTEAKAIQKKLETTKEYVSPAELAALYVGLGEKEQALSSLERAYAAHDLQLGFLGVDEVYDSLRSEPRFKDLIRKVGLPG